VPSSIPHLTARPQRQDYLAIHRIARNRGIGHCTLLRNAIAEWVAQQPDRDLEMSLPQVPTLPDGLNTQFNAGLKKRDKKRRELMDERPSAMGMLVDK
jgi:hypothetical protein